MPVAPRLRPALLAVAAYTVGGLLEFSYHYLEFVAMRQHYPWRVPFLNEMASAYAGLLLLPLVLRFARRRELSRAWWRWLPFHLGGAVVYSSLYTSLRWILRGMLYPLFGLGAYDYGAMPARYLMEFGRDVMTYSVILVGYSLWQHHRRNQERELRLVQVQGQLAQAQLQNLRLQLHPHFLFNALNMISSVMYEEPRRADEMICRLSELLRASLQQGDAPEIRLRQELDLLDLYVQIMQARFEHGLSVQLAIEPGTEEALVPQLLLQPLVENSIRYGAEPGSAQVRVRVSAERQNGTLRLQVRDAGPGLAPAAPRGIGLTNTADRLRQLYGPQQRLQLDNPAGGGLLVTLELPFHTGAQPA